MNQALLTHSHTIYCRNTMRVDDEALCPSKRSRSEPSKSGEAGMDDALLNPMPLAPAEASYNPSSYISYTVQGNAHHIALIDVCTLRQQQHDACQVACQISGMYLVYYHFNIYKATESTACYRAENTLLTYQMVDPVSHRCMGNS